MLTLCLISIILLQARWDQQVMLLLNLGQHDLTHLHYIHMCLIRHFQTKLFFILSSVEGNYKPNLTAATAVTSPSKATSSVLMTVIVGQY